MMHIRTTFGLFMKARLLMVLAMDLLGLFMEIQARAIQVTMTKESNQEKAF